MYVHSDETCFSHFLQVSANTENSSMSGYLNRSKGNKKQWKRLWFVIKNKVLYTYAASEVLRLCGVLFFFIKLCVVFLTPHYWLFLPLGCRGVGESTFARVFPEGGEERAGSEAAV